MSQRHVRKAQSYILTEAPNGFLTRVQTQFHLRRKDNLFDDTGTIKYPYAKTPNKNQTKDPLSPNSHLLYKLTYKWIINLYLRC